MRTQVRSWTTHYTGAKTTIGPAMATVDLLEKSSMTGRTGLLPDEPSGRVPWTQGCLRNPLAPGKERVEEVTEVQLWPEERDRLEKPAATSMKD